MHIMETIYWRKLQERKNTDWALQENDKSSFDINIKDLSKCWQTFPVILTIYFFRGCFVFLEVNSFNAIGLFLYPLKTSINQRFADVSREYRKINNMKWVKCCLKLVVKILNKFKKLQSWMCFCQLRTGFCHLASV